MNPGRATRVRAALAVGTVAGLCHVCNCADARQAGLFTKTTKEVAEHPVGALKCSAGTRKAAEELEMPTLVAPADPVALPARAETRIWEKMVGECAKP